MRFKIAAIVIAVAVATVGFPRPAFGGYEELFKAARAAAWAVYVRGVGGMNAVCSATAFKSDAQKTWLLTAAHCFVGSTETKTEFLLTQNHLQFTSASLVKMGVKLKTGKSEDSTDLGDYIGDDWAIIVADTGNKPTIPIGKSKDLVVGEDLVILGVPLGVDFLAVQGIVGSTDMSLSTLIWNHSLGANIYIASGNSGSGVISVKQRAIVGIVVAGPGPQTSMAIVTPIDWVKF